jgi:ribose transport system substrate-binding protein
MKPLRVTQISMAAGLVSLALVTAACASSGESGSGGASTAGSSPAGTGSSAGATNVAAARAFVQKWIDSDQALGETTPLSTTPPKGKTFVWLNCELAACTQIERGIAAATKLVGWNLKIVDYDQANISSLDPAIEQAIGDHPAAIGLTGLPEAVWKPEESKLHAAGIALIAGYVGPAQINSTLIGNVGSGPNSTLRGQILGDWFISESNGSGTLLNVSVPSLPSIQAVSDSVASTVKSGCPKCTVVDLDSTLQDVEGDTIDNSIAAAINRDPSIKYIISGNGAFVDGLPAALSAAGITGVKIAATAADSGNLAAVKAGTETAMLGGGQGIGGFEMIDIALRHVEGMKVDPYDGLLPMKLLVASSDFQPADDYPPYSQFIPQYEKLWKLG